LHLGGFCLPTFCLAFPQFSCWGWLFLFNWHV
jgi:hypothetical protein